MSDYFTRLSERNSGASDGLAVPRSAPDDTIDDPFAAIADHDSEFDQAPDSPIPGPDRRHSASERDGVGAVPVAGEPAAPLRPSPDIDTVTAPSPAAESPPTFVPEPDRVELAPPEGHGRALVGEPDEPPWASPRSPEPPERPAPVLGPEPEPVRVARSETPDDLSMVPGLAEMDRILLTQAGIIPPVEPTLRGADPEPVAPSEPEPRRAVTAEPITPSPDHPVALPREFVTPIPSPEPAPANGDSVAPVVIGALNIEIVDGPGPQPAASPAPRAPRAQRAADQLGRGRPVRSVWGW